jgi:hypothetical protein
MNVKEHESIRNVGEPLKNGKASRAWRKEILVTSLKEA